MSNYLENLIAKSFDRLEIVRPRLASRFEPPGLGVPPPSDEIRTPETPDLQLHTEADTARQTHSVWKTQTPQGELRPTSEGKLSKEPVSSGWRGEQKAPESRQARPERQRVARQTTEPTPAERRPAAPREEERTSGKKLSQMLPEANLRPFGMPPMPKAKPETAYRNVPTRTPSLQADAGLLKESIQAKVRPMPVDDERQTPVPIRRPVNAEPQSRETKVAYLPFVRQSDKNAVQPRAALRLEGQLASESLRQAVEKSDVQTAEPELPPTINVTIGRIEVRATTPPAAHPRRQKPTAPTMSLEEYLRKRDRGGAK